MSSAFNVNSCFILQGNDISKALCKRVLKALQYQVLRTCVFAHTCVHSRTLHTPNIRSGVIRIVDIIEATRQPFPFSFLKYRTHVLKLYIHNVRVPRPSSKQSAWNGPSQLLNNLYYIHICKRVGWCAIYCF